MKAKEAIWRPNMLVVLWALIFNGAFASIYDCWDPEKLSRMKFPMTQQEANDPNLGKFSKVLKCLTREQTNGPGGLKNMDWSQYMGGGGGQFPSNWNRNNNNNNNQQPGWTRPGQFPTNQQGQPQWPQQQQPPPNNLGPQPGQPQPGVHPNDYNIRPQQPQMNNPNWPSRSGQGQGQILPPPPGPPPQQPPPGWNNNNNNNDDFGDNNRKRPKDRRKNKNKNQIVPSLPPEAIGSLAPGQNPPVQGPTWGTNVGAINDEEAKSMSKKRQFGYAIMACAVVALAVLMVSAIFCCNSSNSTMSQPATVSVQPPDTFSIYSYNNQKPVIGSDTLRSVPLGDTLRTQRTPTPQYRVSDIDPDFARRFREEHY